MMRIPAELLPADGRFGSGPAKIRAEALQGLINRAALLGTSHRQAPVKDLVASVQHGLSELYCLPEGYEVVLGNGGSTLFWDLAVFSFIEHRSAHGVFGEFTRKFARASARAPHLADPIIAEAPAGSVALPAHDAEADVHAWAQNETSTGACAEVRRIGTGLVMIDATSSAGGMSADISQTDLYYFAPQKNFSSDGGLWLAFASPAAIERAERIKASGRWVPDILDFSLALTNSRKHQTLNTPALTTLLLLDEQINWLLENGGLAFATSRCQTSSQMIYDWAENHELLSAFVEPEHRSPVVATIDIDNSIDAAQVCQILRENGVVDVEPYRGLARNQLRIGVYASVDPHDVRALCTSINHVLAELSS